MLELMVVTVEVPVATYEQMKIAAKDTGMSVEQLGAGGLHVLYANPTEGNMKKVLRAVRDWQIDRIVAKYHRERKPKGETTE